MTLSQQARNFFDSVATVPPEGIPLPEYAFNQYVLPHAAPCKDYRVKVISNDTSFRSAMLTVDSCPVATPNWTGHAVLVRSVGYPYWLEHESFSEPLSEPENQGQLAQIEVAGLHESYAAYVTAFLNVAGSVPVSESSTLLYEVVTVPAELRVPVSTSRVDERAQQARRNEAAMALLQEWLAEEADVESQAASLKETIESLDTHRATSRKLFP